MLVKSSLRVPKTQRAVKSGLAASCDPGKERDVSEPRLRMTMGVLALATDLKLRGTASRPSQRGRAPPASRD